MEYSSRALLLGGLALVAWCVAFAAGIVIIVGAVKMLRLKSHNWALAASVLALLPCNPAGLLGLVMGIWGLVVLNRPAVKAAFQGLPAGAAAAKASPAWLLWLIVPIVGVACLAPVVVAGMVISGYFAWQTKRETSEAVLQTDMQHEQGIESDRRAESAHTGREEAEQKAPAGADPGSDDAKIQGAWSYVSFIENGQVTDPEELKGSTTTYAKGETTTEGGGWSETGTYQLDPNQTPKAIDSVFTEGPDKGLAIAGIYELDGDTLTICWAPWGSLERPTEFASTPGSGCTLIVLQREKPAADQQAAAAEAPKYMELETYRRPVQPAPGGVTLPTHVAFSPDGSTLIAWIGYDIHSWERTSLGRKPIGEFIQAAVAGTLSPNGDVITLVRPGGSVELWDVASQQRLEELNGGAARQALFSPDRSRLAVVGENGTLKLWDVAAKLERAALETDSPVTALAFSLDGSLLAGGCADGNVRLWDVESGDYLTTFRGLSSGPTCLAFTPNGEKLAAGTRDGSVHVWYVETGNPEALDPAKPLGPSGLTGLAFSPDGAYFATGSAEGSVTRWQTPDALREKEPGIESTRVRLVRVGRLAGKFGTAVVQGSYAYLSGDDGLNVVDISGPSLPRVVGSCPLAAGIRAVAGGYAYGLGENRLHVVDVSDPTAPREVGSCELEGRLSGLAVGQAVDLVYVTNTASLRVVDVSDPTAPKVVGRLAAAADLDLWEGLAVAGQYAYVGADTGGLRVVDLSDPTSPREAAAFDGPGNALFVTLAGNYAYIAGGEDAVSLWIVDISDPNDPKEAGQYGDWISGGGVAVAGGIVYLLGGELDLVDVSDPAHPKPAGRYGAPGDSFPWVNQVATAGEYVYIVDDEGVSILRAVRIGQSKLETP